MPSADEFISDFLAHYDTATSDGETPAERHERYLRERQLKGRKTGSSTLAPVHKTSTAIKKAPAKTVAKTPIIDPAKRRAATEARIKDMEARLDKLRELLRQLVEKAQERSGVEQPEDKKAADPKKTSNSKKLTEAEKAEAAKRSEEWRKKNPDKVLDQKVKRLETQIKNVEEKIAEMRKKISQSPVAKSQPKARL